MSKKRNESASPMSEFAQMLIDEPELAARCDEIEKALRDAARREIRAAERSEQLTRDDFAIYINARADN